MKPIIEITNLSKQYHIGKREYYKTLRDTEIEQLGIKGMDSLHIACAEKIEVDCFVTCDDKIIKRYKGQVIVKTPVEFISDVMKEETDDKS